ncbi:hypothetical protein LCGC14_2987360 [marine sediment metagenome]|uniref:Uncharacterized protein n=1 Tax=marine sediment metagenome TaxID=412755 RepID=A0A0F8XSD5_9ZZZZ
MNENLEELLNVEIEVSEDFDGEENANVLSDLRQALFESRVGANLSAAGIRGVTHALDDTGLITLESGDAQERLWLRSAAHEAERLGLPKSVFVQVRSQVA